MFYRPSFHLAYMCINLEIKIERDNENIVRQLHNGSHNKHIVIGLLMINLVTEHYHEAHNRSAIYASTKTPCTVVVKSHA